MDYRLALRVKKATFKNSPTAGFMAQVQFSLAGGDFPYTIDDSIAHSLFDSAARTILDVGRNGIIVATIRAKSETQTDWKIGLVAPAS